MLKINNQIAAVRPLPFPHVIDGERLQGAYVIADFPVDPDRDVDLLLSISEDGTLNITGVPCDYDRDDMICEILEGEYGYEAIEAIED